MKLGEDILLGEARLEMSLNPLGMRHGHGTWGLKGEQILKKCPREGHCFHELPKRRSVYYRTKFDANPNKPWSKFDEHLVFVIQQCCFCGMPGIKEWFKWVGGIF